MALKLHSFLVVCNIVLAVGSLIPIRNLDKSYYRSIALPKDYETQNFATEQNDYGNGDKQLEVITEEGKDGTEPEKNNVKVCPKGQSSYTQQDLKHIIDYLASEMKLAEAIDESYFNHAISVRDKYTQMWQDFLIKFENRPKHLKHILEDMAQIGLDRIQPLADEITSKLQNISTLDSLFVQKLNDANIHLGKFNNYKQICALNCDETMEFRTVIHKKWLVKRSLNEDLYYCSTIVDLSNKINISLNNFLQNYTTTLRIEINKLDQSFKNDIEDLKAQLKKKAVKKFGTTMYEVLSLQDDYSHFLKALENDTVASQLSDIKSINLQIDYKIEELKEKLEKYRKHCLKCNNKQRDRFRRDVIQIDFPAPTESSILEDTTPTIATTTNIIDKLINDNNSQVKNNVNVQLQEMFTEIAGKLIDKNATIDDALAILQINQEDIEKELREKEDLIVNLKQKVPQESLDNLSKLYDNSKDLQNRLDEALKYMSNYM